MILLDILSLKRKRHVLIVKLINLKKKFKKELGLGINNDEIKKIQCILIISSLPESTKSKINNDESKFKYGIIINKEIN